MTDTLTRLTTAIQDHYRVEKEIGAGGMATVFLAEDLKHHRKVGATCSVIHMEDLIHSRASNSEQAKR